MSYLGPHSNLPVSPGPSPLPALAPCESQGHLAQHYIGLSVFSTVTTTSPYTENKIQAPRPVHKNLCEFICLLIYSTPISSSFTMLKTCWPSFCTLNFPVSFPFQSVRLLFLLPRTPPDLHVIASPSLSFQLQCFHLRFPFPTTLPRSTSSIHLSFYPIQLTSGCLKLFFSVYLLYIHCFISPY